MERIEQRIRRVTQEDIAITPYDPRWPELFRQEKGHLLNCLPNELIRRIEHFGGTAVPGLAAKPIVDILVEGVLAAKVRDFGTELCVANINDDNDRENMIENRQCLKSASERMA